MQNNFIRCNIIYSLRQLERLELLLTPSIQHKCAVCNAIEYSIVIPSNSSVQHKRAVCNAIEYIIVSY